MISTERKGIYFSTYGSLGAVDESGDSLRRGREVDCGYEAAAGGHPNDAH
jgi:hypothetical protein